MANHKPLSPSNAAGLMQIPHKPFQTVEVQLSTLESLERHVKAASSAIRYEDIKSLLLGALITVLIDFVCAWTQSGRFPIIYGIIAFALFASLCMPQVKGKEETAKHNLLDAEKDLAKILLDSGVDDYRSAQ